MSDSSSDSNPKPRLAYLFSRYPVVSHTYCDNEILGLEEAGWDLVMASLYPPKNDFRHQRLNHLRAPVLYPPPPEVLREMEARARDEGRWPEKMIDRHRHQFGESTQPELRCRNALALADRLARLGIDHLHLHFANRATHTALYLKEFTGIPFSFTPQAQDFLIDLETPELLAEFCREAEFVVAPCESAREKIIEMCPDSSEKLIRIYNGIDPGGYHRAHPKPIGDTLRITSVGRLIEHKGFHHLIAAVAEARSQSVRVEFELLGDGPWRERLENQVAALGLEDRITLQGTVGLDEMKATFGRVDAFVLPCIVGSQGTMDMFPTVINEAMLTGLPVVSCRVAGVPEMVEEGETGFVTEPGDEAALAEKLVRLAREPDLAARLGEAGLRRAKEVFSIGVTLPQLAAKFEETAADRDRKPAPRAPSIAAFYDLCDPSGPDRLRLEKPVIESLGGQAWLAAGGLDPRVVKSAGDLFPGSEWVPDGMVLEMEWRSRSESRAKLERLRTELSTSIDGEEFLEAARRANWWAAALERRGGSVLIWGSGARETLVAWLTHQLTGFPFIAAIEREGVFNGKVRRRILESASAVAVESKGDPLQRKAPSPRSRRVGPVRLKPKIISIPAEVRRKAFREWIEKHRQAT